MTALDENLPSDGQAAADELLVRELQAELVAARAARDRWQEASFDLMRHVRNSTALGVLLLVLTFGAVVGIYFTQKGVQNLSVVTTYQRETAEANACRQAVAQEHQLALGGLVIFGPGTPEYGAALARVSATQQALDKVISKDTCPVPKP